MAVIAIAMKLPLSMVAVLWDSWPLVYHISLSFVHPWWMIWCRFLLWAAGDLGVLFIFYFTFFSTGGLDCHGSGEGGIFRRYLMVSWYGAHQQTFLFPWKPHRSVVLLDILCFSKSRKTEPWYFVFSLLSICTLTRRLKKTKKSACGEALAFHMWKKAKIRSRAKVEEGGGRCWPWSQGLLSIAWSVGVVLLEPRENVHHPPPLSLYIGTIPHSLDIAIIMRMLHLSTLSGCPL